MARTRKKRFSTFLCKVDFDGQVLQIEGRRLLVSLILFLFSGALWAVIVLGHDVPLIPRLGMGLGALITSLGFVDVFFAECFLRYDTVSKALVVRRGSPFGRARFEGQASGNVSVSRKSAGRTDSSIPTYTVIVTVSLDDAIVSFPLEALSHSEEASQQRIQEWEQKLGLGGAPQPPG